jgi:hypothetical protein
MPKYISYFICCPILNLICKSYLKPIIFFRELRDFRDSCDLFCMDFLFMTRSFLQNESHPQNYNVS